MHSDGEKITCSKAVKKRKRNNGTTIPDLSGRSVFVSAFEVAVNSGEEENLKRYAQQYCHPTNCVLHVDMSALSAVRCMPRFREIRGIDAIVSYLIATHDATPDSIALFWQKGVVKTDDGGKDIETDCHFIGKRIYDVEIVKDDSFDDEHSQLETAIFGLAALAGGSSSDSSIGNSRAISSEESTKNRCTVTSLDSMQMLVAGENVHFRRGERLAHDIEINHKGTWSWHLDSQKKITRMKFVMK